MGDHEPFFATLTAISVPYGRAILICIVSLGSIYLFSGAKAAHF